MKKGNGDKQQSSRLSGAETPKTNNVLIILPLVRETMRLHCLIVGIALEVAAEPPDVRKASGFPEEVSNILFLGEA
jgi:hypothetical protein